MSRRASLLYAAALLPVAVAAAPRTAAAQTITWGDGSAIALGSGCNSSQGDTQFLAFGNDLVVLFSSFGVDLPAGGPSNALADLKNCRIAIPATLTGITISKLTQTITYGVNKSTNSSGVITSQANFFGLPVASFSVPVPLGAMAHPAVSQSRVSNFFVNACPGPLVGLYRANMAVSGRRGTRNEDLILAVEGLDLRYDVLFTFVPC